MKYPLLHEAFERIAGEQPSAVAIDAGDTTITYRGLQESAVRLGDRLCDAAVGPVVATFLPAGIGLVSSILAIWRAGKVYMPVQVKASAEQFAGVMSIAGCATVVTDREHLPRLKEMGMPLAAIVLLDGGVETGIASEAMEPVDADGSYIIFTSGTTGAGKPILGSHEGLSQFIHWEIREFAVDNSCRVSQLAQITFDASLRDIFVPLIAGGVLEIPAADIKYQVPKLIEWIREKAITLLHCVPSVLRMIIRETDGKESKTTPASETPLFPQLKHILMAGEALYAGDILAWRANCGDNTELVNLYGTSETTLCKTFHRIGEVSMDKGELLHAGRPIEQAFIAIIKDGRLARIGEIGEVYILSRYISLGYFRNAQKTAERFVPNPLEGSPVKTAYRAGDLARYRKDHTIEVLGRLDDQVKVNGVRADLNELESAILQTPGIMQAVVKAITNEDKAVELACYYTGTSFETGQLRAQLQPRIAAELLPAYFVHLEEFPLSINGKINKSLLPAIQREKTTAGVETSDWTAAETALLDIWKLVFNKTAIDKEVSFFALGGTSLKAIRVIAQVYKKLEVLITINDLFTHPSIAGLAAFVDKARKQAFSEIKLVGKQEHYELSAVQKRIWAIDQSTDNKALYNVPEIYLFEGNLHLEAFAQALQLLVQRHEILRTTFRLVDGEPRQFVQEINESPFRLEFLDYSLHDEPMQAAIGLSQDEALKAFDLAQGPLLKAILVKLSEGAHLFIFMTHHIASDAWSQEIIGRDVLSVYEALATGRKPSLEPIKIQYKDFAAWSNRRLEQRLDDHRSFWLQQFEQLPAPLQLPLDFPRPAKQGFQAEEVSVRLDPEVSKGLLSLASQQGASGYHLVLALVNQLLYGFTGQRDIVLGCPVADRSHVDVENQVGVYFNTLPFRTRFAGEQSFADLVAQVKKETLSIFEHIDYPFENILEDIQWTGEAGRNPLFDVGLTHISFLNIGSRPAGSGEQLSLPIVEDGGHSIQVKGIYPGFPFIKSDLWIKAVENGAEPLLFVFAYNTGLFKASFATRLIADFRRLAALVVKHPSESIDGLVRLVKAARQTDEQQRAQQVRKGQLEVLKHFKLIS
jgi:amino acid adenylation domain-containing protein